MRRHPIFTLNRPFKRRIHNNICRFQRSTVVTASRGRNRRFSQHLDALEVRTRSIHGRAQFYCGLGGHTRAQHDHIVGRAQIEHRRSRRPARTCFCQTLAAKTARVGRPTTLLRNSAGGATSCTDSRSFLCASIQIARYHRLQAGGAGVPGVLAVARAVV